MSQFSLKQRFAILFVCQLAVTIAFCAVLLWGQHKSALVGADIALHAQQQTAAISRLRDVLARVEHLSRGDRYPEAEIGKFRDVLRRSMVGQSEEQLQDLNGRFDTYVDALRAGERGDGTGSAERGYRQVLSSLNWMVEHNGSRINAQVERLKADQQRSIRGSMLFLFSVIAIIAVLGYKIFGIIVKPIESLVDFLDNIDVEDDLPAKVPRFDSRFPEVAHLTRSFDRLLERLRGYRAINVGRLLIEKRRAEVIAASVADGVFLLRAEEILYVNPVGERILGTKLGKSMNLAAREDLPGAQAIRTAISRTIPVELTVEEDDRKVHYLIQAFPIPNSVIEQVEHSVGTAMDEVLDRFQADTIVVAQDVTLVRESEEAKRHFLGTLSHEVRTPVTSLTMATRLLKRDLDRIENPTHRALIKTCVDDVERLRGLVEDLVTVSRFETLTQRLDLRNVDMGKLVRHAVQTFQIDAKERGIELLCKVVTPSDPLLLSQVRVDATKVSWAISNLMTNALRHTPRGGRIEAELEAMSDRMEFRVRDTGPGIDRKRQSRIFDKFNPHYDIRVARTGSAGMGLAITREIVVAHGGRIWVASEPGQGALFAFTLPTTKPLEGLKSADQTTESLKGAVRGAPIGS